MIRRDERAVATQVGAVFVFAFLVLALAFYQGVVVPDHNEEVEFKHNQRVQNDMLEVRNALLRTKISGEDTYVTVELGTEYPARFVGVNPPPATGTVRTTDLQPITVHRGTGEDVSESACPGQPSTRLLEYSTSYSEYRNAPTFVYEHSVLYKQLSNGNVTMTSQTLVEGNTINLVPLKASFSKTGVDAATVEAKAGRLKTTEIENPTITLPTRLSESEWEQILAGQVDQTNVSVSGGTLTLTPYGEYRVRCGPVAIGKVPDGGARGTGGVSINPVGPEDIEFRGATIATTFQNEDTVVATFNNTRDNATTIEEARISFYFDGQGNTPKQYALLYNQSASQESANLTIKGQREILSPKIEIASGDLQLQFVFDDKVSKNDFFIAQFQFESGETGTYFIAPD